MEQYTNGNTMKIDISTFNDKASKEERFLTLYEENDYLTAYAKHTDIRVEDDPLWSIGRGDEWESHGDLQKKFLIGNGLKPESKFLDIGCGIGRAARKIVPYLDNGNYIGVDISPKALAYASKLSKDEGWGVKNPTFVLSDGNTLGVNGKFNIIWAHSVFTHLPDWAIKNMMINIKDLLDTGGKFLFTYKKASKNNRSGLKQFQYPFSFFEDLCKELKLKAEPINMLFPATQHTGCIRWGATAKITK